MIPNSLIAPKNKNVIFRADASVNIGSGHIMRCLVLAQALREHGYQVSFATRSQEGDFNFLIEKKGFELINLDKNKREIHKIAENDYAAWLGVSEIDDAIQFTSKINECDLVVVDHYAIGEVWHEFVGRNLKCKIMCIDDLARKHKADLILDQTVNRHKDDYASSDTDVLAGSQFSLLNAQFGELRKRVPICKQIGEQVKVLVSMGAMDMPNSTLKVLNKLLEIKSEKLVITVVLNSTSPSYDSVRKLCLQHDKIKHIKFSENMAQLMFDSDLAIGAPGSTSWERACLGLPSVIIPLAENQLNIANQLESLGCAIKLDFEEIEDKFEESFERLIKNCHSYRAACLKVTDGNGVYRVMNKINELII